MALVIRDVLDNHVVIQRYANRIEDMDNRLQRNNVHILGLPEKIKGRNPTEYIEQWLLATFAKNNFTPFFTHSSTTSWKLPYTFHFEDVSLQR